MTEELQITRISESDLASLGLTTDDVIGCIEHAIQSAAKGRTWSAPKAVITPPDGRYMMAALAASDEPGYLAVKTVVLNPENPVRGLPQINGVVTMLDSSTGLPVAVVDGNWITAVRTAGLSATAARRLARADSAVAAFIGTGVQAGSHLDAFADMFPLREVRIYGRGRPNIERLSAHAEARGLVPVVCDDPKEAVESADLVTTSLTLTAKIEPFLDAGWLKPGAFAAVTDLSVPWKQETYGAFDVLCIDDVVQEKALDHKIAPPEHISGDLAGLVLGKFEGRVTDDQRTAFVFRGHALGDLALASLALDTFRARQA